MGWGEALGKQFGKLGRGWRTAKWTAVGLGLAGALGAVAFSNRRSAARNSRDQIDDAALNQPEAPIPQPLMQPMLQPGMPQQDMGPLEGRGQNEWRQRVAAQRGMGVEQPQGPNQPAQNIIPESSVEQLGSNPPQRG